MTVLEAVELYTRRAPQSASTWDPDARTVEVVFSAGAGVERLDSRGPYTEFLDVGGFTGAEEAPVLDAHRRDSLEAVLGSVVAARTIGGKAHATLKLSRHSTLAERLANELADGARFGVSVGYTVEEWKEKTESNTGRREKVATRWTVREISIVPVPADRQSTTRGTPMTDTPTPVTEPATPATPETSASEPEALTAVAERAAVNMEIRSLAEVANLDQTWIDGQIDAGATTEQARAAAFEEMRSRSAPASQVRTTTVQVSADHDAPEERARTIGEALFARSHPSHELSERARPFAHATILDIARNCLQTRGVSHSGFSSARVIERALHSTSDFPLILGDAVGRTLRMGYQAAPSGLKRVARKTTAKDFKDKYRLALSGGQPLEKVNESGEFESGTLAEAQETYKVETFGRVFGITRQALVNDDLAAFTDLARRLGQTAAATEANLLVALLTEGSGLGPNMSDGKRLFHSAHGNFAAAGAAPDVTTLSDARTALRKQTGLQGEAISVTPKFFVVPPELETEAEKLLAQITATKADDINPFSGSLQLVVEPRLSNATRWYVVADPSEIDGLEYAYLEGEEGPQIETRAGFEVDGVQIRVRLDFGAGLVDWRSWFANPGA